MQTHPEGHIEQHESLLAASMEKPWKGTMEPQNAEAEEVMLRNTDPDDMVRQVTDRLRAVNARLDEQRGYDKAGNIVYAIPAGDLRRRALEVEKHQLTAYTLPATRAHAADIAARKAALPTAADRLNAEQERRERIEAAAVKRAEEMEVEDAARRLLAQRRRPAGGV